MTEKILFEKSFDHSYVCKAVVDLDGNIINVNKAMCTLLGYSKEELLQKNAADITPDEVCENDKKELQKLYDYDIHNIKYDTKCINRSGEEINLIANAIAIYEDGDVTKLKYTIKEIERVTANTQLQEEIKRKEFYLDKIMSEMPANIYFKDLESRFILVNDSLVNQFGVPKEEIIGKSDFDFFEKEFAQHAFDDEVEIMKTGRVIHRLEKEFWADGKETWVSSTKKQLFDENGQLMGTFGISKDITETKKAEEALAEAHKELSIKNKELQVTLENLKEAQAHLVNSEKLAALGQLIAGIAHEINTPLGAINASSSNIKSSFDLLIDNISTLIINFNEHEITLLKQLVANYKSNQTTQLISREKRKIKKDITEKLIGDGHANGSKIADIIVYLNQHEHIDAIMAAGNDVDLLNVLQASKNLISLIKNSENISVATEKASGVVLALKKYVHKTHDGSKSRTDIIDNIETVLTLNFNKIKQGVDIVRNFDTIPHIEVYPDEISQVWNNLITNSIHAMNNKGTITIDIINQENNVLIKFGDNGCGIPDDIKEKIFTPFFTTKISGEGTGLGMDIIKRIVEKHDGEMSFESEVGKGTTFSILLPKN